MTSGYEDVFLHIRVTPKIKGVPINRIDRLIKFGDVVSFVDIEGEMEVSLEGNPSTGTLKFDEIMYEVVAIGKELSDVETDRSLTDEYLSSIIRRVIPPPSHTAK